MNYKETLQAVELALLSGSVPLIIGVSGIGKTSLVKDFSKKNNLYLINIDANLLKEGEIGGLPMVVQGKTHYAPHHKLTEMDEFLKTHEEGVMLFIDEINRCDHSVQQELMNLILNREINGYKLNDRVFVTAAMNPTSKMESYRETDYQVVDMDPAQEDRFIWYQMDSDPKEWIRWGMEAGGVHESVISFISSFPAYLNYKGADEYMTSTPRSWERVSKALKVFEGKSYDEKTLYHLVKGNVGTKIAQEFIGFLNDNKNPLLSSKDIFEMEVLNQFVQDEISQSSHSRLYILAKNMIMLLKETMTKGRADRFAKTLNLMPKDLRISLMKEIKADYEPIYVELQDSHEFMEGFFDCYGRS